MERHIKSFYEKAKIEDIEKIKNKIEIWKLH
jgi:hypothetical protein